MSKEYDEIKIKPAPSTSQEPKEANESKIQHVLLKRKYNINFDDKKYAVKTVETRFLETQQRPSKLRDLLKSIPVVGGFLVKIFTPEKGVYKKLQLQTGYSNEAKNKIHIDNKHAGKVSSKLKEGSAEQVDNEKSRSP